MNQYQENQSGPAQSTGYPQQAGQSQYPAPPAPQQPVPAMGLPPAYGTLKTLTVVSMVIVIILSILAISVTGMATSGWSGAALDAIGGSGTGAGMLSVVVIVCLVAIACYIAVLVGIGKRAAWGRVLGLVSCCVGLGLIGLLSLIMLIASMGEGGGAFMGAFIIVLIFFGPFLAVNAFWLKAGLNKDLAAAFR